MPAQRKPKALPAIVLADISQIKKSKRTPRSVPADLICQACGSKSFKRHGYCYGRQRFLCKACGSTITPGRIRKRRSKVELNNLELVPVFEADRLALRQQDKGVTSGWLERWCADYGENPTYWIQYMLDHHPTDTNSIVTITIKEVRNEDSN